MILLTYITKYYSLKPDYWVTCPLPGRYASK